MMMIISILVFVIVLILVYQYLIKPRWQALQAKIKLLCTCGYLPEPPTAADDRIMRIISRFVVWIQVGKVKGSGLENLNCKEPKLIVPTHGHYLDPFVLAALVPERARSMAARGLLKFAGGLGALVFSRWGVFCTDLRPGKGSPALRTAVQVLVSGQTLLIFPEGWANMDGTVGPFKPGAASIAHMAAVKAKKPVSIVPIYLRYGRYPSAWIKNLPTSLQCLILLTGFIFFRRGVHVVFGQALLTSELPRDSKLATEQIRNAVLALDPERN